MENIAARKNDEKSAGDDRLGRIVDFCRLIDREKFIDRRTYLTDGERLENDAEHSWHLAVMALLLSEYAEGSKTLWNYALEHFIGPQLEKGHLKR